MFEPTPTWPNFTFGEHLIWIGANNGQIWPPRDEWFGAIFEPTPTWPNFAFGQLFMWIGANNGQIWLPMDQANDSEQCSNQLQLYLISLLVNFSCELGQIMIRYDFPWARRVILSNVWSPDMGSIPFCQFQFQFQFQFHPIPFGQFQFQFHIKFINSNSNSNSK